MEITEVRVRLASSANDRLKAYCSMTIDHEFVVRDIKVIEKAGGYFVAMPSRKMTDRCAKCGAKNQLQAKFCNACGNLLWENRTKKNPHDGAALYADIAHPINRKCRHRIHKQVVAAFEEELKRSRQPGYNPPTLDEPDDDVPEVIR